LKSGRVESLALAEATATLTEVIVELALRKSNNMQVIVLILFLL
jgi:hypothetical protein